MAKDAPVRGGLQHGIRGAIVNIPPTPYWFRMSDSRILGYIFDIEWNMTVLVRSRAVVEKMHSYLFSVRSRMPLHLTTDFDTSNTDLAGRAAGCQAKDIQFAGGRVCVGSAIWSSYAELQDHVMLRNTYAIRSVKHLKEDYCRH